ncbi:hypothetical protein MLD38_022447 [Melastoma candidum]|uniref:Uncharacterized protein n=1 Tax=Melastoma candidum TaxID=119954 RepID=A0ACB9QJB5_9MYRT|nr:hypothetical protein MLD38_022447 [Melastoma candidum]
MTPYCGTGTVSEPESHETEKNHLPSLDSLIECSLKSFGWHQFLQALLVSIAWFFDAQQTFITIFTDFNPSRHCTNPTDPSCTSAFDVCRLPGNTSWAYDLPKGSSTVSDWGLECTNSLVKGLPASSFFIGCLLGGLILATLADSSLGRKNLLLLSGLIMSLSSLLTALSTDVWMYSALRFFSGFGRGTIGTCSIVLSSELFGKEWRSRVGMAGFLSFTLGFLSLPGMAYLNQGSSWRNLYIWTSVPTVFYCVLVHLFIRESPRWLFLKGRKEEALATLKSLTSSRDCSYSLSENLLYAVQVEDEQCAGNLFYAVKLLLENKWAIRRLCVVMTVGFGTGMVYYGMPLGLDNLSFNLYTSVTLNALAELPSTLSIFFLIARFNRRSSLLAFTALSGCCSVLCILKGRIWGRLQIGFELISFFSGCTALDILLIYTLELFPTCVRNSAMSMVRQAVVFGGALSPMLVAAGGAVSFGVFGFVIWVCGVFVVMLPETKDGRLCDTMDEEEQKERNKTNIVL